MSSPDKSIHYRCALVYLKEARARKGSFRLSLQKWAASQREKYYMIVLANKKLPGDNPEEQMELF